MEMIINHIDESSINPKSNIDKSHMSSTFINQDNVSARVAIVQDFSESQSGTNFNHFRQVHLKEESSQDQP